MSKRILIVGLNPFDSGKTILSLKIAHYLKSNGTTIEYFKPLSGTNYWYKHDHLQRCLKEKKYYSYDASRVRDVIHSRVPVEATNPIHTLFVPSIIERPDEIVNHSLALGGWDSIFAMRRFSQPTGNCMRNVSLRANTLIESGKLMLTPEEADTLTNEDEIIPFETYEEVMTYTEQVLEGVLDASFEYVEKETDVCIIEGFNNIAWPWEGLSSVDTVLVTGPGHVFVYDAERFKKAVNLKKFKSQPIREVPFTRISDLLKPTEQIHLSPGKDIEQDKFRKMGIV